MAGRTGGGVSTARVLTVIVRLMAGHTVVGVSWIEEGFEGGGVVAGRAGLVGMGAQELEPP